MAELRILAIPTRHQQLDLAVRGVVGMTQRTSLRCQQRGTRLGRTSVARPSPPAHRDDLRLEPLRMHGSRGPPDVSRSIRKLQSRLRLPRSPRPKLELVLGWNGPRLPLRARHYGGCSCRVALAPLQVRLEPAGSLQVEPVRLPPHESLRRPQRASMRFSTLFAPLGSLACRFELGPSVRARALSPSQGRTVLPPESGVRPRHALPRIWQQGSVPSHMTGESPSELLGRHCSATIQALNYGVR